MGPVKLYTPPNHDPLAAPLAQRFKLSVCATQQQERGTRKLLVLSHRSIFDTPVRLQRH
jgi:hypothetical protein